MGRIIILVETMEDQYDNKGIVLKILKLRHERVKTIWATIILHNGDYKTEWPRHLKTL